MPAARNLSAELGSAMDPQEFSAMLGMLECDAKGRVRYESFASFWLGEAGYSAGSLSACGTAPLLLSSLCTFSCGTLKGISQHATVWLRLGK